MSTVLGRLVDVEQLVVAALLADTNVTTLTAQRVSAELPTTFPDGARIRVSRSGGAAVDDETGQLDRAVLQVEAFGNSKAQAFDVAAAAVAAMLAMSGQSYTLGFVSLAIRLSGPAWAPDPETVTARYLLSMAVYVHAPLT